MNTRLDHIVIGAANLDQGREYIQDLLGVDMPVGGEHPLMATHNLLMQLGGNVFLEVIAINPDAAVPGRPRWYGLDDPSVMASLSQSPRLLTWVVNTDNISALIANTEFGLGMATPVTRGDLRWHFAVPDDGRLLAGGLMPYVMQWQSKPHPAERMADRQCRLQLVEIIHPYSNWMKGHLQGMAIDLGENNLIGLEPAKPNASPELKVTIASAKGDVVFSNTVV